MRFPLWIIAGSLTLLPLSAQSTAALTVRNLVLQQDESIVEFDVVNQASKPLHAWTLAITEKLNIRAMANVVVPYPSYAEVGKRAAMTYFIHGLTIPRTRRIMRWLRRMK